MNNVHFKSDSDEWETPQWLFDELNEEFDFAVDMAATQKNTKCLLFVEDALDKEWSWLFITNRYVFCNPPYSRGLQKQFIARAYEAMQHGIKSVFLIPARTDTKVWHDYIWDIENHRPKPGVEVRFLKGRLKFEKEGKPILDKHGSPQSAPFPSAVVVFLGDER